MIYHLYVYIFSFVKAFYGNESTASYGGREHIDMDAGTRGGHHLQHHHYQNISLPYVIDYQQQGTNVEHQQRFEDRSEGGGGLRSLEPGDCPVPFAELDMSKVLGGKRYICPMCDKTYSYKSEFKTHYMTHSKEKPFKCLLCPYESNQKSHLTRHIKFNH